MKRFADKLPEEARQQFYSAQRRHALRRSTPQCKIIHLPFHIIIYNDCVCFAVKLRFSDVADKEA